MTINRLCYALLTMLANFLFACTVAIAQHGPGVTDHEIKIGQTMPYSGPASSYGTLGGVEQAYFKMVNDRGGINGRKIKLISLDDGFSPPKTVEQTRKLVEGEEVLLVFSSLGTAPNAAVQKYLNQKKVPQLFLVSGSARFADPEHFPWSLGWLQNYTTEARSVADHILRSNPGAKIAVLYQNDDLGKDYLRGIREALGDKADRMVISQLTYEVTDPTIDSQVVSSKATGADTFIIIATAKFGAQAIRKADEIGWKPSRFISSSASSIATVLTPAGIERSIGIITGGYVQDPKDPATMQSEAYADWASFMKNYYPSGDLTDVTNVIGYSIAQNLVHILTQAGEELTRENVMRKAASMKNLTLPMLLPSLVINTAPDDYRMVKGVPLLRFDGVRWTAIGPD